MTYIFPVVISLVLSVWFYLSKRSPSWCWSYCAPGQTRKGGVQCRAAHLNVLGSGAFDLIEADSLFPFSLGMPNPLIHLLFISSPFSSRRARQVGGNCTKSRGFISCHATSRPLPCAGGASGDGIPVLVHALPLLTVFMRTVPFWDAPYLSLIISVTQIELFSSSSKEVPYTLD